jgi:hypothetical protein
MEIVRKMGMAREMGREMRGGGYGDKWGNGDKR